MTPRASFEAYVQLVDMQASSPWDLHDKMAAQARPARGARGSACRSAPARTRKGYAGRNVQDCIGGAPSVPCVSRCPATTAHGVELLHGRPTS